MLTKSSEAGVSISDGSSESEASTRWVLASLSLSILLSSLGTSIANVALPTLAVTFNASFQEVQWVVLAYLLAITTLIVSAGRLGDIIGRRRLLLAGISLFTVASVLCGVAPTLGLLITARAAQGLGAAVMMALTMAMVSATIPKAKTGAAMGLLGTMSAVGTALGPSLGGVLIAGAGWRSIFFLNIPLGVLALLLARRYLPADRESATTQPIEFDIWGTVLLASTLAAYALAVTVGRGRFGSLNLALLVATVGGLWHFVRVQARAVSPLIRVTMFRDQVLTVGLTLSLIVSTVIMTTLVVGPFYLSRGLDLNPALVGIVMSVGPIVAALAGVPAGRIVDRLGAQRAATVGLIAMAAGAFILAMMRVRFGIVGYIAPMAVMTSGYALFQTANNTAVMTNVRPDQKGVISGMLNLSRNLGLITGASVMGAVFALGSGTIDITTAGPAAVAAGMRIAFGFAAVLIIGAIVVAVGNRALLRSWKLCLIGMVMGVVSLTAHAADEAVQKVMPLPSGVAKPTPAGPYPLNASGWGPEAGNGLFFSRWAEDWKGVRAAGGAPLLKAITLGGESSLTLSAEARLRYQIYDNAPLFGDDLQQGLFRGIMGADLRLNPNVRMYGEVGTGQVAGHRSESNANFQNDASLQQLFIDARGSVGSTLVGAMFGRQEFADGPRQLISLSDGPNLHRTWNGARLYAHCEKVRFGAFDFRSTHLESGFFDDEINRGERLQGVNASVIVLPEPNIYLDPFWIHTENSKKGIGGSTAQDNRDTYGVRLWGRRGTVSLDWTLARQTGDYMGRDVDAWGIFAVQSVALSEKGWKPRLTSRIDVASGDRDGSGTNERFDSLYTSSQYLGEGRFLGLNNLLLIAPGIAVSPTSKLNLSAEYGFARRLTTSDAVYAGGMRAYPGTQQVGGHEIGGLFRIAGTWTATENLSFYGGVDHLAAGNVLKRAGLSSGSFGYVAMTFRY